MNDNKYSNVIDFVNSNIDTLIVAKENGAPTDFIKESINKQILILEDRLGFIESVVTLRKRFNNI